jgi:hypothetical protein
MQIPFPWGLIAIFISLSAFYYFNRKREIRLQNRKDRLNEVRQEFLESLLQNKEAKNEKDSTN